MFNCNCTTELDKPVNTSDLNPKVILWNDVKSSNNADELRATFEPYCALNTMHQSHCLIAYRGPHSVLSVYAVQSLDIPFTRLKRLFCIRVFYFGAIFKCSEKKNFGFSSAIRINFKINEK